MAPSARPSSTELDMEEDESEYGIQKADRKVTPGADGGICGGLLLDQLAVSHLSRWWQSVMHLKKKKKKKINQYDYCTHGVMSVPVCEVSSVCSTQTRKPLVEKKRRARINESLQELRTLLADTDVSTVRPRAHLGPLRHTARGGSSSVLTGLLLLVFPQFHSKMENAEVLEMTVKKVEDVLKNRNQGLHAPVSTNTHTYTSIW